MMVSLSWLQKYFTEPLPEAARIAEALTFGVAEIEEVHTQGAATTIDIKVLPDRACYMLSHRGVAREIATLLQLPLKDDPLERVPVALPIRTSAITVTVDDPTLCPVYAAALIRGVHVGPSPQWLSDALEAVGQRSINNVVDATNYVMLDLGTPLHAFDAKKVSGSIRVRASYDGEEIAVLGGAVKVLTGSETVIADGSTDAPLALAGVKGGTLAELTEETTDIILEAATFDPVRTRRTAARHGLRTDASKRFENVVAPELPAAGLTAAVALIQAIAGGTCEGYAAHESPARNRYLVGLAPSLAEGVLGVSLGHARMQEMLSQAGLPARFVEKPREEAVRHALAQLGKPYKLRASVTYEAPACFDCSSLMLYAYTRAGVSIPRVSVDQYVWGAPVSREDLLPGDMVFFNTEKESATIWKETVAYKKGTAVPEGVSHVVMYIGDGDCVHARSTEGMVVREPLAAVEERATRVGCRRMHQGDEGKIVVEAPYERADIKIAEDLVEEVARVYGYRALSAAPLPPFQGTQEVHPVFLVGDAVRGALESAGFMEVYTYTLRAHGDVQLINALASDKSHLRSTLAAQLSATLETNEPFLPLAGTDTMRLYEVGTVFSHDAETLHVCLAVRAPQGKRRAERTQALLAEGVRALALTLGVFESDLAVQYTEETAECSVEPFFSRARELPPLHTSTVRPGITYRPPSVFPFVLRDLALWVPAHVQSDAVEESVRAHAGPLLVRSSLFDTFTKEGRTSYAFHLVFQSHERTLSDADVHAAMEEVLRLCATKGWEVR